MSQVSTTKGHSDSFGKSTGVRVQITTKDAPLGKVGVLFSSLFFIPLLPLVGALIGLVTSRMIANNASLRGIGKARYAMRTGFAVMVLQIVSVFAFYSMALLSIHDAESIVHAHAIESSDLSNLGMVDVQPDFGIASFFPGSTRTFQVESKGIERSVRVEFDTVPTWTSSGFLFGSSIATATYASDIRG